ncbi:hypothetical protein IMG5_115490 [Ichthyophthirius multifiliis]|uniref:E3 ubiquitin-protein ligase n=1 Tax=Ichthyophthirius multifiliis TaxID=5932 RepID=G0QU79_ICHMU|nr:hypothetical protein IMG5_115490 [Ichthyophthirius multifiliis]EGR31216.1 hypothetical protein IMG5_115490 [Ichthyophthirius multifiliis]|eukprot:XP_004034702.1 hypothetical protein IMG5_115490 [Ichthyophthirius multifiliis]
MDPTCIICQECFEKGNHIGHRTILQKGCSGCCDCGDVEAWKKEGFCQNHQGFLNESQISVEQIDEGVRERIKEGFLEKPNKKKESASVVLWKCF